MGYAARIGKKFIARFSCGVRSAGTEARGRGHAEAQDYSWGELSLVSDYLQWIVVGAVAFSAASIQSPARPS
jgi:hypothetical protein